MSRTRAQAKKANKKSQRKKQLAARGPRTTQVPPEAGVAAGEDSLLSAWEAVEAPVARDDFTDLRSAMAAYGWVLDELSDEEAGVVACVERLGTELVARGWQASGSGTILGLFSWTHEALDDEEDELAVSFAYDRTPITSHVIVDWHSSMLDDSTVLAVDLVLERLDDIEAHRIGDPVPGWARDAEVPRDRV